ncbi:metal ion binding [Branchiostoma belcheri]|nr:metal ion binding [Branchiostoma belcheri]
MGDLRIEGRAHMGDLRIEGRADMGDLRIEDLTLDGSDYRRPQTKARFLNSRMGPTVDPGKMSEPPENLSHAKRLQRETDFLSCIYCMAPRPSDPYARYCNECGSPVPPVPGSRLPPPEGGQMGMCVYCKSMVPLNTPTCLVCEAPIPPQLQPQASVVLAGKRVCPACSTANPDPVSMLYPGVSECALPVAQLTLTLCLCYIQGKRVCPACSTANPADLDRCVMCETRLPPMGKPIAHGGMHPVAPKPDPHGRLMTCSKCGRVNNPDARFCDWCGTKPSPPVMHVTCGKCKSSNQAYARYCLSCGTLLEPPHRNDPRRTLATVCPVEPYWNHLTGTTPGKSSNQAYARYCLSCGTLLEPPHRNDPSNQAYARYCLSCGTLLEPPHRNDPRNTAKIVPGSQFDSSQDKFITIPLPLSGSVSGSWVPIVPPVLLPKAPPSATVATQTVGLFYPSFREMQQREAREAGEREKAERMSDKRPPVSAVSPGKGYWRKQIDHICGHLRAYAQNTTEFRANVGEPRMGKLVSATVHEDGYELSLAMTFALRGNKDVLTGKPMRVRGDEFLSNLTEGRRRSFHGSSSSLGKSGDPASHLEHVKDLTTLAEKSRGPSRCEWFKPYSLAEDRLLLQEVGPKGEGNAEEVQKLLDEGADPNLVDNDDRPVLTVAVMNNRHESIPVLVQAGAEVDKRSGPKNNTALHEAVNLGPSGKRAVQALLGCNANSKRKNDKSESPYDLAVKLGDESILKSFASSMGQDLLDKMTKPGKAADIEAQPCQRDGRVTCGHTDCLCLVYRVEGVGRYYLIPLGMEFFNERTVSLHTEDKFGLLSKRADFAAARGHDLRTATTTNWAQICAAAKPTTGLCVRPEHAQRSRHMWSHLSMCNNPDFGPGSNTYINMCRCDVRIPAEAQVSALGKTRRHHSEATKSCHQRNPDYITTPTTVPSPTITTPSFLNIQAQSQPSPAVKRHVFSLTPPKYGNYPWSNPTDGD